MTTPGGRLGTYSSKVSWPKMRSHLTNHEKSFCRACRNRIPLPTRGNVLGGFLRLGLSARTTHYTESNGKEEVGIGISPSYFNGAPPLVMPLLLRTERRIRATTAIPTAQVRNDIVTTRYSLGLSPFPGFSWVSAVQVQSAVWYRSAHGDARRHDVSVTPHSATMQVGVGREGMELIDVCQLQLSADPGATVAISEGGPSTPAAWDLSCGVLERCRLGGPCAAATLLARPPVSLETSLHSTFRDVNRSDARGALVTGKPLGYVLCFLPRHNKIPSSPLNIPSS